MRMRDSSILLQKTESLHGTRPTVLGGETEQLSDICSQQSFKSPVIYVCLKLEWLSLMRGGSTY